jgi:DNA-binding CsgD family transcriptional regulator
MLVALNDKSKEPPRFSGRLDLPNAIYALSNPIQFSREIQMLNFLKEALMLAKNTNNIRNFLQNLSLHCPTSWGILGICLRRLNSSNHLEIETQILNDAIKLQRNIKVNFESKSPSIEAIRYNTGIFFESRNSLLDYSPEGKEFGECIPELKGLICLPLSSYGEMWGSLEFIFGREVDCDEGIQDFFCCVALIVGTAIDHAQSGELILANKGKRKDNLIKEADLKLNPNLKKLALMIAAGRTNAEIAREMCFSESTARYETVKLYAMLRVKNRAEAGAAISRLGIQE